MTEKHVGDRVGEFIGRAFMFVTSVVVAGLASSGMFWLQDYYMCRDNYLGQGFKMVGLFLLLMVIIFAVIFMFAAIFMSTDDPKPEDKISE